MAVMAAGVGCDFVLEEAGKVEATTMVDSATSLDVASLQVEEIEGRLENDFTGTAEVVLAVSVGLGPVTVTVALILWRVWVSVTVTSLVVGTVASSPLALPWAMTNEGATSATSATIVLEARISIDLWF